MPRAQRMERLGVRDGMIALFALAAAAATSASAPAPESAARALIARDWVLHQWALKHFDADGDRIVAPAEAERAAAEFRNIADGDGDGRVSRIEYRQARDFILARY